MLISADLKRLINLVRRHRAEIVVVIDLPDDFAVLDAREPGTQKLVSEHPNWVVGTYYRNAPLPWLQEDLSQALEPYTVEASVQYVYSKTNRRDSDRNPGLLEADDAD